MRPVGSRAIRVLAVAATMAVAASCADSLLGPPAGADHAAVFDELWHQVDLHYSFFALKQINWDSVGAHYRPLAVAAPTDIHLALVLSAMLSELRDVHVSLTPSDGLATLRYESPTDTGTSFSADLVFNRYLPSPRTSPNGQVHYGMLNASVGYVRIASFEGTGLVADVDAALDGMRDATQLVIDVRDNAGGVIALAAEVAGRFTDRSRTFGYVRYRNGASHDDFTAYQDEVVIPAGPRQFTGPVFVLTNRRVVSSAEDFVLAMRAIPTAMTVGDTTAGASGAPIVRDLPNGWTFQVSEWIEYTPARQTFEGVGLAPTVVVKQTAGVAYQYRDAALDTVLVLAQKRE